MLSSFEEDMEKGPTDKERQASLNGGMQEEPKDTESKNKVSAKKSGKVAEESAKPKNEESKSQSNLRDDKVTFGGAENPAKPENKTLKSQSNLSNSAKPRNDELKSQTNLRDDKVVSGGACVRDVKKDEKSRKKQCFEDKERSEKASKSQAGCSKNCKGIKDDDDSGSYKFTVCTSAKQNRLAYRIKRSKKRIANQVKSGTKKSVKKLKNIYKSISAKRAMGFKCNLRKCKSTLVECSKSCTESDMLFSGSGKEKAKSSDDEKHHTTNERQMGTMTNELEATNKRKKSDKSIVTVEEKDTNT